MKTKKNIREKSGSMKDENVLIEPEGHPEAREALTPCKYGPRTNRRISARILVNAFASRAFCVTMNREKMSIEKFKNIDGVKN